MYNREIRNYEVSIWTLQDSFISVLKASNLENKGRIQDPEMNIKDDGTQEFSFKVPMYLYEGKNKKENPVWYTVHSGNLLVNMRKLKVIFNKLTADEKIFEFIITEVVENHENGELICEIKSEGLAFHELGKIGYKISLNTDDFLNDYNTKLDKNEEPPHATIDYWCEKILVNTNWRYEIEMDWSSYSGERSPNKVYENDFISSWNIKNNSDILSPAAVEKTREKERLIDVKESNIYNITQTIAEIFGVFCRYEYEYDEYYHIIGRKIIFYNNFIQEASGVIDLTYPYNSSHIERTMDGTDIITKMYVKNLTDNASDSGYATIMDTEANKSGEEYLLNFDYMYSIGTISQEQYDFIPKYEKQIKEINNELIPLEEEIGFLENKLIEAKANATIASNAIALDEERLGAAKEAIKAIIQDINSNPDDNREGAIKIDETNPEIKTPIINGNSHFISLNNKGVIVNSIKIYKNYNNSNLSLSNEINDYSYETDEFGNLSRINIYNLEETNLIYITYSYKPRLYYENIINTWTARILVDTEKYSNANSLINELDGENGIINLKKKDYENKLNDKQQLIYRFEKIMGPALREGNWQPEDNYSNYGDKKTENLTLSYNSNYQDNVEIDIGWDSELFDDEGKNYESIGVEEEKKYYPYIKIDENFNNFQNEEVSNNIRQYGFCYTDVPLENINDNPIKYYKFLTIGSGSRVGFLKIDNEIHPVLMLIDTVNFSTENDNIKNAFIGRLKIDEENYSVSSEQLIQVRKEDIISTPALMVYPRIKIKSSKLKISEDELIIYFNMGLKGTYKLKNYEEYYVSFRIDDNTHETIYCITINPEFLFKYGLGDFKINYSISNTGLIMYLDAIQVLKENAYPKVSYTIDPSLVNKEFTRIAYKALNKIVHINDYELKFENIQGYISELVLDLDHPWEDKITITNYKTKFEDLFNTIVAQTEDMKKNSYIIGMAANAFTNYGTLSSDIVQNSINKPELSYAFNNGNLTIDNANGIWGTSDDGVVAMRGGGIFTANQKDADGNWIWNTGILPSGINASLITTGQLDTNLIRIFAGDDLRFQMNGDGIFAYKNNVETNNENSNAKYYARYYSEGLFLHADDGVKVSDNKYVTTEDGNGIDRVELSWNGLILRNWNNEKTLSTNPNTGDLTVRGNIQATGLSIVSNGGNIPIDTYINNNSGHTYYVGKKVENNKIVPDLENIDYHINDIWINSETNEMFRYSGTDWETVVTNFDILVNNEIAGKVTLNTQDGLLIQGSIDPIKNVYPYFQVTSDKMGFFKHKINDASSINDEKLLYYDNGNLTVTGTIQASTGWLGGKDGWKIDSNEIASNDGKFFLITNYKLNIDNSNKIPSLVIRTNITSEGNKVEKRLIINQKEIGLKDYDVAAEITSQEALGRGSIQLDFEEGTGEFNRIYAENIAEYSDNKLIMYMYQHDENHNIVYKNSEGKYLPVLSNSLEDFINALKGHNYSEAEFIIDDYAEEYIKEVTTSNEATANEQQYLLVESAKSVNAVVFEHILTPVVRITGSIKEVNDNIQDETDSSSTTTVYYYSPVPPIKIKNCSGAFYFKNISWENYYIDNLNVTNNEIDSTISSYCIYIDHCNAFVNLEHCWVTSCVYGLINYGGRMNWYNGHTNLPPAECQEYFAVALEGGVISFGGIIPSVLQGNDSSEQKEECIALTGGYIINQGDSTVSGNTPTGGSIKTITSQIINISKYLTMTGGDGYVGRSGDTISWTTFKFNNTTNEFINELLNEYYNKTDPNASNKLTDKDIIKDSSNNNNPQYKIMIDSCAFRTNRAATPGNGSPEPYSKVYLCIGTPGFLHAAGGKGAQNVVTKNDTTKAYMQNIIDRIVEGNVADFSGWIEGATETINGVNYGSVTAGYSTLYYNRCRYTALFVDIDFHIEGV